MLRNVLIILSALLLALGLTVGLYREEVDQMIGMIQDDLRAGNTQVLWPDYRDDILDDTTSDTAKYYVHKSAKDMLYAYADTMFYAETAQGLENGALVGTVTQETVAVFPWWIPCMTAFNAVALAVILYLAVPKDLFRKKGTGNTEVAA